MDGAGETQESGRGPVFRRRGDRGALHVREDITCPGPRFSWHPAPVRLPQALSLLPTVCSPAVARPDMCGNDIPLLAVSASADSPTSVQGRHCRLPQAAHCRLLQRSPGPGSD